MIQIKFYDQQTLLYMNRLQSLVISSLLIICPFNTYSVEQGALPHPWNLQSDWWQVLTKSPDKEIVKKNLADFVASVSHLENQVPQSNRDLLKESIDKVSKNIEKVLVLRSHIGWKIEPAPEILESYSVDDLLNNAKKLRNSESSLFEAAEKKQRLLKILNQAQRREDELHLDYLDTPSNSLQRVLTGLSLIIATSSRAVLTEQFRISEEKIAGLEQRIEWDIKTLESSKENLSIQSINSVVIDNQLSETVTSERLFQEELLQTEAELLSNGSSDHIDDQSIIAMRQLISHASDRVKLIIGKAKKGLLILFDPETSPSASDKLLQDAKSWLKELKRIKDRTHEWRKLIQMEKEAAESLLTKENAQSNDIVSSYMDYKLNAHEVLDSLSTLDLERYQAAVLVKYDIEKATKSLHWLEGLIEKGFFHSEKTWSKFAESLSYTLFRISERPVTLFKILRAIGILILAYIFSKFLQKMMDEFSRRKVHVSKASLYTFNRVAHYFILLIGSVWALSSIGIDFSNLLILAGALSVGIGFGLQGIVNNFLGGLIVLFDRKLRIGDFIELSNGEIGHITEVNVQNTIIRTLTGHDILVPNSDMITKQLTNWTLRDQFARIHIPFGVAYGEDKDNVKLAVEKAATSVEECVVNHKTFPDPRVWLVGFGDSSLNFELVIWVDLRKSKKRQSSLRAAFYWEIETALRNSGIEIPFPQRDVHIKSGKLNLNKASHK